MYGSPQYSVAYDEVEAVDRYPSTRVYPESADKGAYGDSDHYTSRLLCRELSDIERYSNEDPSYSPSPIQYELSATGKSGDVRDSSHREKRRRKDSGDSFHNDGPTPSCSPSPRTPSAAEDSRRQTAEKEEQRQEDQLPKPLKERPDGTGSGVVDYLLNKYTTYFES